MKRGAWRNAGDVFQVLCQWGDMDETAIVETLSAYGALAWQFPARNEDSMRLDINPSDSLRVFLFRFNGKSTEAKYFEGTLATPLQ